MDDKTKRGLAQEGRLWLLGLVCAVPGAIVASRSGSWWVGAGAFLLCLVIFGPLLYLYERRRKARLTGPAADRREGGPVAKRRPETPPKSSVNQTYGQQKRRRPPSAGR